jgi:uncharacterized protein (TIGR03437 family)
VITIANIVVPQAIAVTKVTAQVQIEYPNSGDLEVFLFSPYGTRTILLENDCNVANVDTTFDDSAQSSWKDFCPVEAGRGPFRADQPLTNFNKDDSSFGTWRLTVQNDQSNSRTGWITQFSLTITGVLKSTPSSRSPLVINAASIGGAGTVAPGELVSILGIGLGPLTGVSAGSGALPSSLGGTTVTFNGVAAPISYASAFRVDAQAPFSLVPGTTVNAQVNSNAGSTGQIALNVLDSVPGLYTNGVGGSGPVTTVNQNGSLNSILSPAAKGSYITIYASGLGAVSPALVEGAVPPSTPLSTVTGTIAVDIDGINATVLFAGAAPGFPGVYQLNIVVPAGVGSGSQELVVYLNGKSTQSGATIQIQ